MRPRGIDGLRNILFYRNGTHVMSRKLILTKAALASIPELVASGLSRNEIAERLGCKLSTLKVRCSQERIRLPRRNQQNNVRLIPDASS